MEKRATARDCVHNYVKEWRKCASNDRTWLIFFTIYNSFNPELQSVICMLHRLLTTAGFTHGAWWANFSYLTRQPANLNTALYVLSFHTGPDWPSWEKSHSAAHGPTCSDYQQPVCSCVKKEKRQGTFKLQPRFLCGEIWLQAPSGSRWQLNFISMVTAGYTK